MGGAECGGHDCRMEVRGTGLVRASAQPTPCSTAQTAHAASQLLPCATQPLHRRLCSCRHRGSRRRAACGVRALAAAAAVCFSVAATRRWLPSWERPQGGGCIDDAAAGCSAERGNDVECVARGCALAAACLLWYVAAGFEVATFGCWSGNAAVAGERERGEASRGGAGTRDRASPDASSRHSSEFVGRVCLQRHRRARGRRGGGGSAPCARTVPCSTAARCREAALGGANSSMHRPRPRQRRENIVVRKSSKGRWSAVRQRSGRSIASASLNVSANGFGTPWFPVLC